jgi:glycosyltransferase involved in cell wall biosynthesis
MMWSTAAELAPGAPAVATIHTAQLRQSQLRRMTEPTASLLAQEQLLRDARAVIAPSPAAATAVIEHVPEVAARVHTIPLGIADSAEARDAAAHPEHREHGLIVSVGRFADINGTADLWELLAAFLARRGDVRAVVAGGVPENPKAERRWRRQWRARAAAEVQERVTFTGWLPRGALAPLYARAAVIVSAGWFETFGLAIAEAMLFGAPVVATRSGGADALIEDGRTGRLCLSRNPAALADAVAGVIEDRAGAAELGCAAAAFARDEIGIDRSAAQVAELYARTLADVR